MLALTPRRDGASHALAGCPAGPLPGVAEAGEDSLLVTFTSLKSVPAPLEQDCKIYSISNALWTIKQNKVGACHCFDEAAAGTCHFFHPQAGLEGRIHRHYPRDGNYRRQTGWYKNSNNES